MITGQGLRYDDLKSLVVEDDMDRPVLDGILAQLTGSCRQGGGVFRLMMGGEGDVPLSPESYLLKISNGNAVII